MKALTVAKFGGTSVADHSAMSKCAAVIKSDVDRRLVIVSACSGVTNLLVALANGLDKSEQLLVLEQLKEIHFSILSKLPENTDLNNKINILLEDIAGLSMQATLSPSEQLVDKIVAYGELISSHIFTHLLNSQGIKAVCFDIRSVLKTDSQFGNAEPNLNEIAAQAQELLLPLCQDHVVVSQGFIGSDQQGETTTLGRGGSDYSAALLAEALKATTLEIWTDVPGIYSTDPRVVQKAKVIDEISFSEASEMAKLGAKILHPATLLPAMRHEIPVFVGSSKAPEQGGTWIRRHADTLPLFRALALRGNQTMVTLTSIDMLHNYGFLMQVFSILAKYKISVDLVTTSEISITLTLDKTQTGGGAPSLPEAAKQELSELCHVKIEQDLCLVALIGNNLSESTGAAASVFCSLDSYKLRMICFGASNNNLCFLAHASEAKDIVQGLHKKLFE